MQAGWDAAPAGGDGRTPAPGRPRDPIGQYYGRSAGSLLDWDCANDCRTAEALPARKGASPRPAGSEQKPGNAGPGNRNRRFGAPRGASVPRKRGAARRKTGAPLGAPFPRLGPRGKSARRRTRRRSKNTGDETCALSYPSPERGGSGAKRRGWGHAID